MNTPLAGVVALASGICFALASALQHRAAVREPPHRSGDPRLLLRLVQRPLWIAGGIADLGGISLQAVALGLGPLAVVQPVLVSGLFLSVPLEAALDRRRPQRRHIIAVLIAAAGLAAFLVTAVPGEGIAQPSTQAWLWTGVATAPVVAACLLFARYATGSRRATWLGVATGVIYGVGAALLKTVAERLASDPFALLTDWRLYALIVVGAAGLVLNQNAFQGGALTAPLTALTLAEPVVALVIGVTAFQEKLATGGPRIVLLVIAALVMARGIWLASAAQPAPDPVAVRGASSGIH